MAISEDPNVKNYLEMKEKERLVEKDRFSKGYNIFKMSEETRKICLANEKKKPRRIDGTFSDHVKKYY